MGNPKLIAVEVVYAKPDVQQIIVVEVEEGATIETTIERSGILEIFHEIDLLQQKVGIFSKPKKLTDIVHAGDRVEIYRPLSIDPKEARQSRVERLRLQKRQARDRRNFQLRNERQRK